MNSMMRLAVCAGLVIAANACSDDEDTGTTPGENQESATVTASTSLAFLPATVNITTGGVVTWVFQAIEHNVTFSAADGVPADITNSSNTSTTRSFPAAGVYQYHCTIHPTMTGTVRVGQ